MLTAMPQTFYGELGALLSALIVVFSLIGLTLHSEFYAGIRRRDYWVYYTNLSNLLVFLYFAVISPLLYANSQLHPLIPHAEYALMMSILLTHLIFHFLLFPYIRQSYRHSPIVWTDSLIQHYLVPWLTLIYWLLCSPGKTELSAFDALVYLIFPLVYLFFVFIRAKLRGTIHLTDSAYPYPFLDIDRYGTVRVFYACMILFLLCAITGMFGVALTQILFILFGEGHSLVLI